MKETELAAMVIAYLHDLRYEVHQEVHGADIVGKLGDLTWIIECKMGMGFNVLAQAEKWRLDGAAHFISVATPRAYRGGDGADLAEKFCRERGLGWIEVSEPVTGITTREYNHPVRERVKPLLQRTAKRRRRNIARFLNEHTASGYAIAGSPSPREWTPFKQFCVNVRKALPLNGDGLTAREIIAAVDHHYASASSARARVSHFLQTGVIDGVELVEGSHPPRWRLAKAAA